MYFSIGVSVHNHARHIFGTKKCPYKDICFIVTVQLVVVVSIQVCILIRGSGQARFGEDLCNGCVLSP